MQIFSNIEHFTPQNFVIIDFYGEETCFAWRDKSLVVFPYGKTSRTTVKLPVILAPRDIKTIRESGAGDSRVFIVCKPMGIYKLNQAFKFCLLSHTGVGMAAFYYQIFSIENQRLYVKDKATKRNRELFHVQKTTDSDSSICEFVLSAQKSDTILRRTFHQLKDHENDDVCIIANGQKIFAFTSNDVQLVHHCEREIVDIVGILKEEIVVGFVLVAKDAATLVYVNNKKLVFDKIHLDNKALKLCAGICTTSDDLIWIAYIDEDTIYYCSKSISTDTFRRNGQQSVELLSIHNHKNKNIIGLSINKQLLEIDIKNTKIEKTDAEEFYSLRPEMLRGSEDVMNEILERAKELQKLNEILFEEQEKLKRINIYAHKQAIVFSPNVKVERIGGCIFLRVTFDNALPINCYVVVSLRSAMRDTYCMKLVEDTAIVVDFPIDNNNLDTSLQLNVDLVTMTDESRPWCLIRDYTKNPKTPNNRITEERARFLRAKLAVLRKFISDGNFTMKQLSELKRNIRREL